MDMCERISGSASIFDPLLSFSGNSKSGWTFAEPSPEEISGWLLFGAMPKSDINNSYKNKQSIQKNDINEIPLNFKKLNLN